MDVALRLSGTTTTWHSGTGTKRINLTNVPCVKQKGQYPKESAEGRWEFLAADWTEWRPPKACSAQTHTSTPGLFLCWVIWVGLLGPRNGQEVQTLEPVGQDFPDIL